MEVIGREALQEGLLRVPAPIRSICPVHQWLQEVVVLLWVDAPREQNAASRDRRQGDEHLLIQSLLQEVLGQEALLDGNGQPGERSQLAHQQRVRRDGERGHPAPDGGRGPDPEDHSLRGSVARHKPHRRGEAVEAMPAMESAEQALEPVELA
eukprot:CAMPEP_0175397632 /NCGR_PEP_ID=MMETSP0095-20121207/35073_1 /TAXON_ID=311494 /ORGANISM="Alexandrium monilatum, Strain CCMP3105" /LENGTH=152 /DNA_ID=CAMNT_0016696317 /DNA_START=632 /DNA_END=1090 /DNA_ORIENTATION=-